MKIILGMNNKHAILLVTPLYPPDVGGPATHALFIESHLPQLSYQVTKCYFGEVKKYPYIIRHVIFFFQILFQARKKDTVYALDPLGVGLPAGLAAIILGKHFVVRIAGDRAWETGVQKFGVTESLEDFARQKFYLPERPFSRADSFLIFILKCGQLLTASLAHKIIVPSEYLKRVVANWGVDAHKIMVVHSAYESQLIDTKEALRHKYGIRGFSIVSAGRLVPWKGMRALIELWPEIMALRGDVTLTIMGDGPERTNLQDLISLLRLDDVVLFTGNVLQQEVLERVRAADLFVLNTGYEGLSHQLLEVMDQGTPVITTNVGGNPELIENGKEGILVEYNNHTQILAAIRTLMEQPLLVRSLTEHAHAKLTQFDPKHIIQQLTELL